MDGDVVRRAKRYAGKNRTSLSRLVEQYLELVSRGPEETELPPVLRRLRGSLKGAKLSGYRRHLRDKYR